MKKPIIVFFLLLQQLSYSQKVVSYKNIGVIFSEKYDCYLFTNFKRFTPNQDEINQFETLLNKNIQNININKFKPLIHENLNNYNRQYIGIFNEKGEKIIHINFFWREDENQPFFNKIKYDKWKTEWFEIQDGGSYYWNIKYNLIHNTFFDFRVNSHG
ncbi:hypothetical protein N4T20_13650 [Flavobacterium sp. TR2]|uniref:hypothetical protein n=1 Tax=Flavobacterium sp. TR2 TaxID=2977321 RepID=UPI0021B09CFC|nr:hypothetical protein [Flavobacterium sp. TR2]UWY26763.1 hypothetical protein N4T20_13650 [Flavobacterium sp. TR2]